MNIYLENAECLGETLWVWHKVFRSFKFCMFIKVKGVSQSELLQLLITAQMLPHVVLMSSFHWPNDNTSSISLTTVSQATASGQCTVSIICQLRLFNLWTWREISQEEHAFISQEVRLLRARGDVSSQECADFRSGEWQPWWLSNRYSVVIETMFHSAGETWFFFFLKANEEPWIISRYESWFKSFWLVRSTFGSGNSGT